MSESSEAEQRGKLESSEELLNVLRESDSSTLTTPEIAEELPIGGRAVQKRAQALNDENRLVLAREGNPHHWKLDESEPADPVYREEYAQALRRANQAADLGDRLLVIGVGIMAAIGLVTTATVNSQVYGVDVPVIADSGAVVIAGVTGLVSVGVFLVAWVAHIVAVVLPRLVEWRLESRTPD